MAFHIEDTDLETLVRKLARTKGVSMTDAIKLAVRNELQRHAASLPLRERLREIATPLADYPRTGKRAEKDFFDGL